MELSSISSYDAFREFYRGGLEPLGTRESGKPLDPALLNYFDALAFGENYNVAHTGQFVWDLAYQYEELRAWIIHNRSLLELLSVEASKITELDGDQALLKPLQRYLLGEELSAKALSLIPDPVLKDQLTMWQRYQALGMTDIPPFYPVSWKGEEVELKEECAVLMDPLELDWTKLLKPIKEKRVLFVFPNKEIFAHCLAFNPIYNILKEQPWLILTEEHEPLDWRPKELVHLNDRAPWRDNSDKILAALPEGGESLRKLGRQLHEHQRAIHLGKKRLPAYINYLEHQIPAWDRFLESLPPVGRKRELRKKGAQNIAYVMPWLKSGTPEAERVTEVLIEGDRERFVPLLLTTELQIVRLTEYPSLRESWPPTFENEERLLKKIHREAEIDIFFASGALPYLDAAREIADKLQERAIHIAVFIGDDIINEMAAVMCDVPLTVLWGEGRAHCFAKQTALDENPESVG